METIYLICLLVGGFFVALSLLGGADHVDADADFDVDAETDGDVGDDADGGPDFVDLLSIRALFLFAAFFGLTGVILSWMGSGEPFTAVLAVLTGLVVGLGGNYVIKHVGYEHVSSDVGVQDLQGLTGRVLIPFAGPERGKIQLVAKGHRLQLLARSFDADRPDPFQPGDEVVVVRMNGPVAEVVKPD